MVTLKVYLTNKKGSRGSKCCSSFINVAKLFFKKKSVFTDTFLIGLNKSTTPLTIRTSTNSIYSPLPIEGTFIRSCPLLLSNFLSVFMSFADPTPKRLILYAIDLNFNDLIFFLISSNSQ